MILIIGGEAQGKRTFASSLFDKEPIIADCSVCEPKDIMTADLIISYHELIRRYTDKAEEITEELCKNNPEAVITLNEIGCGIIPIEKREREYREAAGKSGCIIAERAKEVYRLFCGKATKIK